MIDQKKSVVVVGGGVIGVACAHYLERQGWQVTVLERSKVGGACSHGNCGFISPSHVLPLAVPGAVSSALKTFFQKNPPLRIRPSVDTKLWRWLWRFARYCNNKDMMRGGRAIHALLKSSLGLYHELVKKDGVECEWQPNGLMMVYQTPAAMDEFTETNELLEREFDEPAERLDPHELLAKEPALLDGLAGAWYYEEDVHVRPDKLLASWRANLAARGVEFVEQCEIVEMESNRQRVTCVKSRNREFAADKFVIATGAWSAKLERMLGCKIPIQPGKGYSITMPHPSICPKIPMLFPEHRVGVTPMKTGYRLGSIMEFAGYDETIKPQNLSLLTEGAKHYLQEPTAEPIEEQWYGWRPMTCDSVPIIGFVPRHPNVCLATGHNMLGLSMATGTGQLVSELLSDQKPHVEPHPYRVNRW